MSPNGVYPPAHPVQPQPPYQFQSGQQHPNQQPFSPNAQHPSTFQSGPSQPFNGVSPAGIPSHHIANGNVGALAQDLSRVDLSGPSATVSLKTDVIMFCSLDSHQKSPSV